MKSGGACLKMNDTDEIKGKIDSGGTQRENDCGRMLGRLGLDDAERTFGMIIAVAMMVRGQ